jgi:hypothetical protein
MCYDEFLIASTWGKSEIHVEILIKFLLSTDFCDWWPLLLAESTGQLKNKLSETLEKL